MRSRSASLTTDSVVRTTVAAQASSEHDISATDTTPCRVIIIIIIPFLYILIFKLPPEYIYRGSKFFLNNKKNNNNNNNHDNVYGALIMTEVIARVHPVHLMNVD